MKKFLFVSFISLSMAMFSGCGESDTNSPTPDPAPHDHHESPEQHACGHASDTPTSVVTTNVVGDDTKEVEPGHAVYNLSLQDVDSKKSGYFKLKVEKEGDVTMYFSKAVTVEVTDADGTVKAFEEEKAGTVCPTDFAVIKTIELDVATYNVKVTHDTEASIKVLVEAGGHDHDHDHDHDD